MAWVAHGSITHAGPQETTHVKHPTRRRVAALLTLAGAAASAAPAHAACATRTTATPFAAFGDPASYFLAPDGGFEAGGAGWTLAGGAKVVTGNEPLKIAGAGSRSLSLPVAGASATSPYVCVGAGEPMIRVMQRAVAAAGVSNAYVSVFAVARNPKSGAPYAPVQVAWLGQQAGNGVWAPSQVIDFRTASFPALQAAGTDSVDVAFRFVLGGTGGGFTLDALEIDPFRGA
jgi:hypothetical protein